MKFKVGDKIKCIYMPDNYYNKLEIGNIYTFAGFWNKMEHLITVKENNRVNCYHIKHFEKINTFKRIVKSKRVYGKMR